MPMRVDEAGSIGSPRSQRSQTPSTYTNTGVTSRSGRPLTRRLNLDPPRQHNISARSSAKKSNKRKRDDTDDTEQSAAKAKKTAVTTENRENRKKHEFALDGQRALFLVKYRQWIEPLLVGEPEMFENTLVPQAEAAKARGMRYRELVPFEQQPRQIVGGEMRPFQLEGLAFMMHMASNGMNFILGDEMGLGKTLQTLAFLAKISSETSLTRNNLPHLIICPLSVLNSWITEFKRWLPDFKVITYHGVISERERIQAEFRNSDTPADAVVATYESYSADQNFFKNKRWNVCVLDEGHKIKNHESLIAKALQNITSHLRVILTGTPLQNNLIELWSLWHFLYPSIFTEKTSINFMTSFDLTKGSIQSEFLEASRKLLGLVMVRRTKDVVDLSIPDKVDQIVYLPLLPFQKLWYERILTQNSGPITDSIFSSEEVKSESQSFNNEPVSQSAVKFKYIMNLLMQLRRICDHPFLIKGVENQTPNPALLAEGSSKLLMLNKLLSHIRQKKEKVLVFSQWTTMLDCVEDVLLAQGVNIARIDGSTPRPLRSLYIRLFQQKKKSPYDVFLLSTSAGGLGINLTAANHVVLLDSTWNPQVEEQALARAHRIGQKKIVQVYRFVCKGSVEDQMLSRLRKKQYLSLKVMTNNNNGVGMAVDENLENSLTSTDLRDVLKGGLGALASKYDDDQIANEIEDFKKSSFEEIMKSSSIVTSVRNVQIYGKNSEMQTATQEEIEAEEKLLLSGVEQVKTRFFEGRHIKLDPDKKQLVNDLQDVKDGETRARKARIEMVDGFPVLSAGVGLPQWTAVRTITSDPAKLAMLSDPKKEKMVYVHQDFCIVCDEGGDMFECTYCPRVCHAECVGMTDKEALRSVSFRCPQHKCEVCTRSTSDAGGLLFRCCTCSASFCDDCLPSGDLTNVGLNYGAYENLGYTKNTGAWYILCTDCTANQENVDKFNESEYSDIHKNEDQWNDNATTTDTLLPDKKPAVRDEDHGNQEFGVDYVKNHSNRLSPSKSEDEEDDEIVILSHTKGK